MTFDVAEGSAGEPDDDTWILIGLIGIGLAFGAWKLMQRKPAQPAA